MKYILVPVNFSDCAGNAARYAADLALALKAELYLIHVIEAPLTSAEMVMTEYLYGEMVESASTAIKQLQADLIKHTHGKVHVSISLEVGRVNPKVKEACEQLQPYVIVLGSSGPSLEKFLAGSPLASLLQNLSFPVLVVPEHAAFRHFYRIVLACDLDDIGSGLPNSMPLLKDLREHFGSRFDIVTVETSKIIAREQAVFSSDSWKEQLKDLYPEIHLVKTSKVEEGILKYLSLYEADLVMVFPKKHGLFDFHVSQSGKFAKHSYIPVMSLHE